MAKLLRPCGFTSISNEVIAHKKLTCYAKAVYSYLMMRPEGWEFYLKEISSNFVESDRIISKAIRQLEEEHYLVRLRKRQNNGRFSNYDYFIFNTRMEYENYLKTEPDLFENYDPENNKNLFVDSSAQIAKNDGKINIPTSCTLPPLVNRHYNNKDITKEKIYKKDFENKNSLFENSENNFKNSNSLLKDSLSKETNNTNNTNTKEKTFSKPSPEEIKSYCTERNNNVSSDEFYNYYETVNWNVGKNKMKDWKAAVRYWEAKQNKYKNNNNSIKFPFSKNNAGNSSLERDLEIINGNFGLSY
jgi:hypothetical protein